MVAKTELYQRIFDEAYEYLLSLEHVNKAMIDRHLNSWKETKPRTIEDMYLIMINTLSNKQGMPYTIGSVENLSPFLEEYNPHQIFEKYNNDWEQLFITIKNNYQPPGPMDIDRPKSYWVIFCRSIISSSKFLSGFSNVEEFNRFVSQFYLNEYTRIALPLLMKTEIFGLGFALACDFLKESGYPKFAKPDVHLIAIFNGIGLSNTKSDYEVFKDIIKFSEKIDQLPYCVDKLFWLVGSGNFYLDEVKVKTNRDKFIETVKRKYNL